jgi:hypothetical protein
MNVGFSEFSYVESSICTNSMVLQKSSPRTEHIPEYCEKILASGQGCTGWRSLRDPAEEPEDHPAFARPH